MHGRRCKNPKICKKCGIEFRPFALKQKYCSTKCYYSDRSNVAKEWWKTFKLTDKYKIYLEKQKNKKFSLKIKKILSKQKTGKNNPMYGIHLIGKLNGMYGKKNPNASKYMSERWNNPKLRGKLIKKLKRTPTTKEKILINWFNEFSIPFEYVGNWKFFIGRKCPDFKHKCLPLLIEYNGFYRHTKEEEIEREKYFEEHGFKVLFLHYQDLNDKIQTINKIKRWSDSSLSAERIRDG